MTDNNIMDVIGKSRELERSLRVDVKLSHDEVDRILVNRLISIRNSEGNRNSNMNHIDATIRHFLTEDEFQKYAVKNIVIPPM